MHAEVAGVRNERKQFGWSVAEPACICCRIVPRRFFSSMCVFIISLFSLNLPVLFRTRCDGENGFQAFYSSLFSSFSISSMVGKLRLIFSGSDFVISLSQLETPIGFLKPDKEYSTTNFSFDFTSRRPIV